ncbi:MAG: glycosyltransferase [Kiritimatiellae bacterium]|nr:glycosyltransferase [Kiritimatiellia bacterium]
MRILICHNSYQNPGGEDSAFDAELTLLEKSGHSVVSYVCSNDDIGSRGGLRAALAAIWNPRTYKEVCRLIDEHQPDILHCHNLQFVLSPSLYWAARSRGVPIVQTLHNFRLICPNALLLRDGIPCTLCIDKRFAWAGIRYACYRNNRATTAVLATLVWIHDCIGTWTARVDRYIALTHFAKGMLSHRVPADKISVLPNFAPRQTRTADSASTYVLYAGRLSTEKGVQVLLDAWTKLPTDVPLKIVGNGPLEQQAKALADTCPHVELLNWLPRSQVQELIADAAFVLVPSTCYEGFPVIIAEAFAQGVPVIATRSGGLEEIMEHGQTGLLCDPGDSRSLADSVSRAWQTSPIERDTLSRNCREEYEHRYSPEAHLQGLLEIYESLQVADTTSTPHKK